MLVPSQYALACRSLGQRLFTVDTVWLRRLYLLVFLVIVLLSPNGLLGLWDRARDAVSRRLSRPGGPEIPPPETSPA